jgi:hypothetical protein
MSQLSIAALEAVEDPLDLFDVAFDNFFRSAR